MFFFLLFFCCCCDFTDFLCSVCRHLLQYKNIVTDDLTAADGGLVHVMFLLDVELSLNIFDAPADFRKTG